jgi:hypothetical protein
MLSIRSRHSRLIRPGGYDSVAVRRARPDDDEQIRRLAALDDQKVPCGPKLVAEADGNLMAALGLADRSAIADPFHPTANLVRLLELRAAQLA